MLAQEEKRPWQAVVRDRGGNGAVHVDAGADAESASMAAMVAAPPAEWPAIAMRDGSISPAPGQARCVPVSSPRTKETSAARPAATFSPNPVLRCRAWRARQVVTRPSGKAVAKLS